MQHPVIFFDGVCNLCTGSVLFIIKRDPEAIFRFASLQSDAAKELLEGKDVDVRKMESLILLKNGRIYRRSRAALEIARQLTGLWPLFYAFIIIPGPVRDVVYNWVAGNRYSWFGKKDQCMVPTPELSSRFID